jgi:hypothetical protein
MQVWSQLGAACQPGDVGHRRPSIQDRMRFYMGRSPKSQERGSRLGERLPICDSGKEDNCLVDAALRISFQEASASALRQLPLTPQVFRHRISVPNKQPGPRPPGRPLTETQVPRTASRARPPGLPSVLTQSAAPFTCKPPNAKTNQR